MSKIDKSLTVGVEIEYPSSSASFVIRRMSLTLAKCSMLRDIFSIRARKYISIMAKSTK